LKIVFTALLPGFAHLWAILATQPVVWMRGLLGWLARLPGAEFPLPAWPVWGLVLVYAVYALFLIPTPVSKLRYSILFAPIAVVAAALILPFRTVESAVVAPQEMRLTLLAIGAGQAGFLETPSGKTIAIDAGSSSLSDPLRKAIEPFLRQRGCTHIDSML